MVIRGKYCRSCDRVLPIIKFSRAMDKKDGLKTVCKECVSKQSKKVRKENKRRNSRLTLKELREQTPMKKCCSCKSILSSSLFYGDVSSKDGLGLVCKKCLFDKNKIRIEKIKIRHQQKSGEELREKILLKKCSGCFKVKSSKSFNLNRSMVDGLNILCKSCAYEAKKRLAHNYKKVNSELTPEELRANTPDKYCSGCKTVKGSECFNLSLLNKDGLDDLCRDCSRMNSAKRCQKVSRKNNILSVEEIRKRTPKVKCSDCGHIKSSRLFNISRSKITGLSNICRSCTAVRHKIYYDNCKELNSKLTAEELRVKTPTKKCFCCNLVLSSSQFGLSYGNLDGLNSMCRKCANKDSSYRIRNDLHTKLASYLRRRLYRAIKNNQKSGSAVSDLGCSIEFLKVYFESKFRKGMTWDNWGVGHGKWNIDHINPLASFDLTDRKQFLKACHYTNLQPLWFEDNMCKNKPRHRRKENK